MSTDFIGQYVIVRCRDAGVHAGKLVSRQGRECVLSNSRRLDRFYCAKGDSLTAVALYGIEEKPGTRIGGELPLIMLTENCEIIPCSEKAQETIERAKEYMP